MSVEFQTLEALKEDYNKRAQALCDECNGNISRVNKAHLRQVEQSLMDGTYNPESHLRTECQMEDFISSTKKVYEQILDQFYKVTTDQIAIILAPK